MGYCLQDKKLLRCLNFTRKVFILYLLICGTVTESYSFSLKREKLFLNDSIPRDTTFKMTNQSYDNSFGSLIGDEEAIDTVSIGAISRLPYFSLQEILKGNAAGVYIQDPSGEPGTFENIFIHGSSSPLLNKNDLYNQRPAVYINGIPIIEDNPFVFDIQKFDFNPIGPATNLLTTLDLNDISSIEVIKDPGSLAFLGPNAADGAIWIITKNAHPGSRHISVDSYVGFGLKPNVFRINADYENAFEEPFYDRFATSQEKFRYPAYLRDSMNSNYYGSSNWTDLYYKNAPLYSVNLSLSGGSDRANFKFSLKDSRSGGTADGTGLNRYGASFFINMQPLRWLTASVMVDANKLLRQRNKSIRDRLAEVRYFPSLADPLSPNKDVYKKYLSEYSHSLDDNTTNAARGYFRLNIDLNQFHFKSDISFDYNEGRRSMFLPTTLLNGFNFVSDYFGYNKRFIINNMAEYDLDISNGNKLIIKAGQAFQEDVNKYDYMYGYNGPNDFIKVNVFDPTAITNMSDLQYTPYIFTASEQPRLASYYTQLSYDFKDEFSFTGLIRSDGSSNAQPDHRWFLSYALNADWNMSKRVLQNINFLNLLNLHAGWGRIGKPFNNDRFAVGSQYVSDIGWPEEPTMSSYMDISGISRPYTQGGVGYNIPWQYSVKSNVGIGFSLLHNRITFAAEAYSEDNKNLLVKVPVPVEGGYSSFYKSGMWINNSGIDLNINVDILKIHNGLHWTFIANLNHNKNKLKALPDSKTELEINDRKLVVGEAVDQFWLLKNEGVYNSNDEVPINPQTGQAMTYKGISLQSGDPQWQDSHHDYVIDDEDKQLMGYFLPTLTGGFGSVLSYKGWSLDFNFYFVLGRNILNKYASSRLDFINNQNSNNINSVKEIWFWEKRMDLSRFPMYNPWSNVVPYQSEQDLFLENGSFLKLQSASLSYNLKQLGLFSKNGKALFNRFLIYISGTNLFTLSPFKADNPELVTYNGIYDGYGLPIPLSLTFGLKITL